MIICKYILNSIHESHQPLPIIFFDEFKNQAETVVKFFSFPQKRKYEVKRIENDVVYFIRVDANVNKNWSFDLKDIYNAYVELDDFKTLSFKK